MAKTINLSNLFDKHFINDCNEVYDAEFEIIEFAKAVAYQTLELAAENAEIDWIENDKKLASDSDYSFRDNDGNWCKINISEESILNTMNQIE